MARALCFICSGHSSFCRIMEGERKVLEMNQELKLRILTYLNNIQPENPPENMEIGMALVEICEGVMKGYSDEILDILVPVLRSMNGREIKCTQPITHTCNGLFYITPLGRQAIL